MPRAKLSPKDVETKLTGLAGWTLDEGKLYKKLTFPSFGAAFAFMTRVAKHAEELDHHPEWLNVYDTVRIHLATHDAGGITDLDFELARRIDAEAAKGP